MITIRLIAISYSSSHARVHKFLYWIQAFAQIISNFLGGAVGNKQFAIDCGKRSKYPCNTREGIQPFEFHLRFPYRTDMFGFCMMQPTSLPNNFTII